MINKIYVTTISLVISIFAINSVSYADASMHAASSYSVGIGFNGGVDEAFYL